MIILKPIKVDLYGVEGEQETDYIEVVNKILKVFKIVKEEILYVDKEVEDDNKVYKVNSDVKVVSSDN